MTREEYGTDGNIYQMSITNGKEYTSEDAVSREWLLEQFAAHCASGYAESEYDARIYANLVKGAPSVQPERAKGEWMPHTIGFRRCSNCKSIWSSDITENMFCNYCPRCGADMRGENDADSD